MWAPAWNSVVGWPRGFYSFIAGRIFARAFTAAHFGAGGDFRVSDSGEFVFFAQLWASAESTHHYIW